MQKNKSNVKRLIDNIASLGALQLLNYLAPLLLIPFLTRVLEVKEFGAVMAAMATIVIAYIITDYGFSLSLTYRISKRRENRQYINNLISVVFTAKIILSLLASVVVIIVSLLPSYYNYKKIFWMGLLAVFSQAYQPIWLFQGLEKIKNYAAYMALTKISHVFLTFLLVSISNNGFLVLLSWSISNFIGMMIGIYMLMRMGYEIRLSSFKKSIKELKKSSEFFWSKIAVIFYTSGSSIIVGMFSLQQAAIYAAAEQGYKAGQAFTTSISQALYPYMAKEKNFQMFLKILFFGILILGCGAYILAAYSDFFIVTIFGNEYSDSSRILKIMMCTLLVNFFAVCLGYPALSISGNLKWANKSVIVASTLFLICIAILFYKDYITPTSMAITVFFTELLVAGIRLFFVAKYQLRKNILIN